MPDMNQGLRSLVSSLLAVQQPAPNPVDPYITNSTLNNLYFGPLSASDASQNSSISSLQSNAVNYLQKTDDISLTNVKIADLGGTLRSIQSVIRDTISIMHFGAIGDGARHPLSQRYATLAAAQAVYPFVTSLNQEMDSVALQAAQNTGKVVIVPDGTFMIDTVTLNPAHGGIRGAGRSRTTFMLVTGANLNAFTLVGAATPDYQAGAGRWTHSITGVTFDGSLATNMNGYALSCTNCAGFVMSDILFRKVYSFASFKNCFWTAAYDVVGFDLAFANGIGFYLDGGSFVADRLFYESSTPGGYIYEAQAFIMVVQTYGVFLGTGVVAHIRRGLYVAPGPNQFCEYSTIGSIQFDQCSLAGVELFANQGVIRGWQFFGTWAATCSTGFYLHINNNTNTGVIYRPEFIGCRAVNCLNTNVSITDVVEPKIIGGNFSGAGYVYSGNVNTSSIDNSVTINSGFEFNTVMANHAIVINGSSYTISNIISNTKAILTTTPISQTNVAATFTSDTQTNIYIDGNTTLPTVVGVVASKDVYSPTSPNIGILVGSNVDKPIITDNDFSGVGAPMISNRTSAYTEATIRGNRGAATAYTTLTSAATFNMTFAEAFTQSGTANVTAIAGPAWPGRTVIMVPTQVITFSVGPTIGNSYTTQVLVPVYMHFSEGRWFLK